MRSVAIRQFTHPDIAEAHGMAVVLQRNRHFPLRVDCVLLPVNAGADEIGFERPPGETEVECRPRQHERADPGLQVRVLVVSAREGLQLEVREERLARLCRAEAVEVDEQGPGDRREVDRR